jgi:hypothetical protein
MRTHDVALMKNLNMPTGSRMSWFAEKEQRGIEPYSDRVGFASSRYQLSNSNHSIRPLPIWELHK